MGSSRIVYLMLLVSMIGIVSSTTGYNLNDDVFEMYNNKASYYFNVSNGMQWTQDPVNYWTKNVYCLGYYDSGTWNKLWCVDELNGFEHEIDSGSDFVNVTLWKDVSYGSYDLRLAIRYSLKENDDALSITVYAKNIGIDIPYDLGFLWRIKDIQIDGDLEDMIKINGTIYNLDDNYDLIFQDMVKEFEGEYYHINHFNIWEQSGQKYIRLDWEDNVFGKYLVRLHSENNQENSYIDFGINAGHFNPNQEKQTIFKWEDPEGLFINSNDINDSNVGTTGTVGVNGSNILIVNYAGGGGSSIYFYDKEYNYLKKNGTAGAWLPRTLWMNNSDIYVGYSTNKYIDRYDYDFNNLSRHGYNTSISDIKGLTNNGTNFLVLDKNSHKVYVYALDWTELFSFNLGINWPAGLDYTNGHYWSCDNVLGKIYKFNITWDIVASYDIDASQAECWGLGTDGNYLYTIDTDSAKVYVYQARNACELGDYEYCLTEEDCENANFFWYEGSCHDALGDADNAIMKWINKLTGGTVGYIDRSGNMILGGDLRILGYVYSASPVKIFDSIIVLDNYSSAKFSPELLNVSEGNISTNYYFGSGAYLTDISGGSSGGGDITDVLGDEYITNGTTIGLVQLIFNESRLNRTIALEGARIGYLENCNITGSCSNITYMNYTGNDGSLDINGHVAFGGTGSIDSGARSALIYAGETHTNPSQWFYGMRINPILSPSSSWILTSIGIGGYMSMDNHNLGVNSKVEGLEFGPWGATGTSGGTSNVTAIGIKTWGTGSALSVIIVGNGYGIEVAGWYNGYNGGCYASNLTGIVIRDSAGATISNNLIQLAIEKPTAGANRYQLLLYGNGLGSGIWFNSTTGARIWPLNNSDLIVNASMVNFQNTVSAVTYIDRSSEYDKLKYGSASQYLNDVTERAIIEDGELIYNHESDPDFLQTSFGYSCNCRIENICKEVYKEYADPFTETNYKGNETICIDEQVCETCIGIGRDIGGTVSWLRQVNYEHQQEIEMLKKELCLKDSSYSWCK